MAYTIVTDSCCNLPEEIIDEYGIEILPLTFMVDGVQRQSYIKGEKTDLKEFYDMMRDGKVITTSLPNMVESEKTLRAILDAGNDILFLSFPAVLSGTFQATELLMKQLAGQYTDRKLIAVDTLCASAGQGIMVLNACKKQRAGESIENVAQYVRDNRDNVAHWVTVDDLMFLFRGGRLSRTSALAGTLLNIKPVIHVNSEGALEVVEKIRGRKKAIKSLIQRFEDTAIDPASQTIFVMHADCLDEAEKVRDELASRTDATDFIIHQLDPVIGAHVGPGTVAVFFLGTEK